MKKLNVDRMRRYIARNTPDRIQMYFDVLSETSYQDYIKQLGKFSAHMRIKHGGHCHIEVFQFEELARHPGEMVYIARVVKGQTKTQTMLCKEHEKLRLDLSSPPRSFGM